MNNEELRQNYHDGRCEETCRAHDPHWNWTHHEMAERIKEMRGGT